MQQKRNSLSAIDMKGQVLVRNRMMEMDGCRVDDNMNNQIQRQQVSAINRHTFISLHYVLIFGNNL